jgi:3-phenylpropionate/trans-cinnamate dioxygenase ferredoxin reductase subunit
MNRYEYLVVGGGMTADSAVRGIREVDPNGFIGLFGSELHPPYDRPPLSKKLWTGKPEDSIWRNTPSTGAEILVGRRVVTVDPVGKTVTDSHGTAYAYGKLLLATGGTPRRLPVPDDGVIYFRTLDDYRRLRDLCRSGQEFVVIGGGFIGSEIAAALAVNGKHVSMIFPGRAIGARAYPQGLAEFLNGYYREKGVNVLAGEGIKGLMADGARTVVLTTGGREIAADGVVAGIGIEPGVALAKAAGLEVGDGIVVDEQLRTSNPDIYAAGDVANFYNPALDRRMRVEHEDNANTMGAMAGRNMAGQAEAYHHLPYFYTDLFDLGYEAVGELDATLETVEDWIEPFRKGVVYYLKAGQVRGVLLWDVWGKVDEARALIASKVGVKREELAGRIVD